MKGVSRSEEKMTTELSARIGRNQDQRSAR